MNVPECGGGLGDRVIRSEPATGELVQILRIRAALAETPGFELALRERVARLGHLRNASYARILRVERLDSSSSGTLGLVSDHVEGVRLAELLRIASERDVEIDISTTISTIRQLVSNTALLHEHAADIAHGLISPERLIVTPRGRIVIGDHVLSGAVATLHYSAERLWQDLRIAVCPSAIPGRITHRDDVMAIGLVALALVLGRPVRDEEFPASLPALLDRARERSAFGHERRLSEPFRGWLSRALQLDPRGSFASAPEAWIAFEQMVAGDAVYTGTPIALEMFLYSCTAALIKPAGAQPHPAKTAAPPAQVRDHSAPASQPAAPRPHANSTGAVLREVPPPSVSGPSAAAATPAREIDWSAARPPAPPLATARDITDLFSAVDRLDREETSGSTKSHPAQALPPGELDATLDDLADPVPQSLREAVLPEPVWEIPDLPRPSGSWRRYAIAAGVAVLALGGVAATRLLQPPVVAAMEAGTLSVESSPSGLQVLLDGVERGVTPARIPVQAGEHILEVRGPGAARVVPLTVSTGESLSRHFEFVAAPPAGGLPGAPAGPTASSGVAAGTATSGIIPAAREPVVPVAAPATEPDLPAAPPTWGWIAVKAPFPLQLQIGERTFTSSGQRIRIGEGRHRIELRNTREGFQDARVVHVLAGKVTEVTVELPADGSLNVNASPWAEVWIGGRRVGETPIANIAVPAGQHEVVLRHPELGEQKRTIAVAPGIPVRLSVDMR